MKIDGSCHCGFITYEAEIDLQQVGVCHCTDCQSLTVSAFTTSVSTGQGGFQIAQRPTKNLCKDSGERR